MPIELNTLPASLTVEVEGFLVRVTFGDHHGHDDVLETGQQKHAAVLHVGQIFSNLSWIERNIPGIQTKPPVSKLYPLNPVTLPLLEELRPPFLRHGREEGSQLPRDDHAGVKEDAAQNRESQQTGRGSAGVQLQAGASSPHQDGQWCHQADVQEEELQVT